MNLQQLSVFREVMRTGSVSAAARNLHRTQPAVSASLKALETSLGMELFQREGRRLVPVPEAQYLLSETEEILDRLSATRSNLARMRNRVQGSLRIVAMPGPSAYLLPEFVSRFKGDAQRVRITLSTRSSPQVLNLIAAQSFDVGFCDLGFLDTAQPQAQNELYNDVTIACNCVCALPVTHPLARQDSVSARDLDGMPMGALQQDHATFRETRSAFEREGAAFNISVNAQYFIPLFHFVEAGQICAVVDPMSAESYRRMHGETGRIHFAKFSPAVAFEYSIVTPQQRPPSVLARKFVSSWEKFVRDIIGAGA